MNKKIDEPAWKRMREPVSEPHIATDIDSQFAD